jgi:hypothetical protein
MKLNTLAVMVASTFCLFTSHRASAESITEIEPNMIHIRQAGDREWSGFSEQADANEFRGRFLLGQTLSGPGVIGFEQQDVKQTWIVSLNGESLGRLARDENAMRVFYEVHPDQLTRGLNELRIYTTSDTPDDIRIGRAVLVNNPQKEYLNQRTLKVQVKEGGQPVPCRLTIINQDGALQTTGLSSSEKYAVRPGVLYVAQGSAEIGLPPGRYTVIASRGPEYEIDQQKVDLRQAFDGELELSLSRVVETSGWLACDTHVHTLTHSGHGDSIEDERILTIAGEGVELPIITEHNKQISYADRQSKLGMSEWYTVVTGNEVTTKWGHFNVWPVQAGGVIPGFKGKDWKQIFKEIEVATPEIIILNHAEDLHSGYRPFGRKNRHRLTGHHLEGWKLEANAMEVVNSGAQQSDLMQLPRDWMVCLNRGQFLTPVGCSDSHDVSRHFVGQGRTYIQGGDDRLGQIDTVAATQSFRDGRVVVSCGLIPMVMIEQKYGPGDLVPKQSKDELTLNLTVNTPDWIECNRYEVYLNGELVLKYSSDEGAIDGLEEVTLNISVPDHDVHIEVAVFGPGVTSLHWPIAKPYQPDHPNWNSQVFGMTGAIWYDGNGDQKRNCAREIAAGIWKTTGEDAQEAIKRLKTYDRAVALQMAELVHESGHSFQTPEFRRFLEEQPKQVERAFVDYWDEWRQSEIARLEMPR